MTAGKKTHWVRTFAIVLAAALVISTALAVVQFITNPSKTYARATLLMTFDGAADGIAPNGNTYNLRDISSDEVLSSAIEKSGLGDKVTVDALRDSLTVQGVYPSDIVSQTLNYDSLMDFNANREVTYSVYHPTQFTLTLYNDMNLKSGELTGLLDNILSAFRDSFASEYAMTASVPAYEDIFEIRDLDYSDAVDVLKSSVNQLYLYAQEMAAKDATLSVSGIGRFTDIAMRLENLYNNDLERLNGLIRSNSLSVDKDRLVNLYRYQIAKYQNQLTAEENHKAHLEELIESYHKNEVVYVNSGSSMTRMFDSASITYDALTALKKSVSDTIGQIQSSIYEYDSKIIDLQGIQSDLSGDGTIEPGTAVTTQDASGDQAEVFKAELDQAIARRDGILEDFRVLLAAYNEQEINDVTVAASPARYVTQKLMSTAFASRLVMTAGPICALALMGLIAALVISRRREEKAGAV